MKKDNDIKRSDIDCNIIKEYNKGIEQEYNKVSTVTGRVKGQSTKIPDSCP